MKAAFIDRDGVINEELDYVHRVEDFHLLPGVVGGLKELQAHGWKLVVVTNQAGIARGLYTEADYQQLTAHMQALLAARGVALDGVYHCPHHPQSRIRAYAVDCQCRKPRPGMLLEAASDLGLTLSDSVIVGDKLTDLQAGDAAGLAARVLVESGHPTDAAARQWADHICAGLAEAAHWIVGRTPRDPDLR